MKRCNYIIVGVLLVMGFIFGVVAERHATDATIDDIQQVAQEACDVRIKMIRETCKK